MMQIQEALKMIERRLGVTFPPSYKNYLVNYQEPFELSRLYPDGHFITMGKEVRAMKKFARIGNRLLPFFLDKRENSEDYYCFDLTSPGPEHKVVVFSIHAVVYEWENFNKWLQWSRMKSAG